VDHHQLPQAVFDAQLGQWMCDAEVAELLSPIPVPEARPAGQRRLIVAAGPAGQHNILVSFRSLAESVFNGGVVLATGLAAWLVAVMKPRYHCSSQDVAP